MSRHYPPPLLRPAGDIDLVVRKHEYAFARAIIDDSTNSRIGIDVDPKYPEIWKERPSEDFWLRTRQADFARASVAILGPEDTLRMQCFHY
jgi:hypothetical protein